MSVRESKAKTGGHRRAWRDVMVVAALTGLVVAAVLGLRPRRGADGAGARPDVASVPDQESRDRGRESRVLSVGTGVREAGEQMPDPRAERVAALMNIMRPAETRERVKDAVARGREGLSELRSKREDCLAQEHTVFAGCEDAKGKPTRPDAEQRTGGEGSVADLSEERSGR